MTAQFFPNFGFLLDLPVRPLNFAERGHKRAVKTALRGAIIQHHKRTIGKHFSSRNRSRYEHENRSPVTKAIKQRTGGGRVDLVDEAAARRAGRSLTKDVMKRAGKVRVGGTVGGDFRKKKPVTASMTLERFPFPVSRTSDKSIDARQMAKEIATWEQSEADAAAKDFLRKYMRQYAQSPQGRRKKKIRG